MDPLETSFPNNKIYQANLKKLLEKDNAFHAKRQEIEENFERKREDNILERASRYLKYRMMRRNSISADKNCKVVKINYSKCDRKKSVILDPKTMEEFKEMNERSAPKHFGVNGNNLSGDSGHDSSDFDGSNSGPDGNIISSVNPNRRKSIIALEKLKEGTPIELEYSDQVTSSIKLAFERVKLAICYDIRISTDSDFKILGYSKVDDEEVKTKTKTYNIDDDKKTETIKYYSSKIYLKIKIDYDNFVHVCLLQEKEMDKSGLGNLVFAGIKFGEDEKSKMIAF